MSLSKPYHRLWRPVKGYSYTSRAWEYLDQNVASLGHLSDDRFANQAEMRSLVTTAHLIIQDLYEIFNFIEPDDSNLGTFSHRIYELLLRTATEFEANSKSLMIANGYAKAPKDMKITDYFKIASAARLSEYSVAFNRWSTLHEFKPFDTWNGSAYAPLPWYQGYNHVKHNRYTYFREANLENLMNAVSALLCILHAQIGENMAVACFEGLQDLQINQEEVTTNTFFIKAPSFPDAEKYGFIWDDIKLDPNPVLQYHFTV